MNRFFKATTALLMSITMVTSLTACGSPSTGSASPQPNASTPFSLTGSSSSQSTSLEDATQGEIPRILIAYFTRSEVTTYPDGLETVATASLHTDGTEQVGNTAAVAGEIERAVGGDLFPIRTVEEYPPVYRDATDLAMSEQTADARPALSTQVEKFDDYDIIFIGYPSWWGDMPMALRTFLESYDFTGKTILPFGTHAGSGLGVSEATIATLCPGANQLKGLAVSESQVLTSEEAVRQWLINEGILGRTPK